MKKRKYEEGGEVEMSDEDKGLFNAEVAAYKVSKGMDPNKSGEEEHMDRVEKKAIYDKPLAKASFKEAFAEARANGDKTFEWGGKKYSTAVGGPSFKDKAKKAGFTSAETKGGAALMTRKDRGMKAGGSVKSSASSRGDGCAVRGKTRGRMV